MADLKANGFDSMDRPVVDTPPPYSQRPTEPPETHAPVSAIHAPLGVMHAGVFGTNVGMVGTNVGVVGTNVGVVGTNVGMVGTNVMVGGNVGMGYGTTVMPIMVRQQISPSPVNLTCKSCHAEIKTRVEHKPTWKTHIFAGLLCLGGCWCCVCIPYFMKPCVDGHHYCPNCNAYLGSYLTF